MSRLAILTLSAALTFGALTNAHAAARAARVPSPKDEVAAEEASRRGHLLYVLDRAGWVSTDALLAAVPDPAAAGIRGWVVDVEGYHLKAIYYRLEGDQPFAVFTADVLDGAVTSSQLIPAAAAVPLNPRQTQMVHARMAATHADVRACTTGGMNTVVIPPGRLNEPIEVYVLSAQVKVGELPFGGHYKLTVDSAGAVTAERMLTRACMNMATTAPDGGAKTEGVMVTHDLDPTPTEVHVFESLQLTVPLYVMTPAALPDAGDQFRVWRVRGGQVEFLATQQAKAAP